LIIDALNLRRKSQKHKSFKVFEADEENDEFKKVKKPMNVIVKVSTKANIKQISIES